MVYTGAGFPFPVKAGRSVTDPEAGPGIREFSGKQPLPCQNQGIREKQTAGNARRATEKALPYITIPPEKETLPAGT